MIMERPGWSTAAEKRTDMDYKELIEKLRYYGTTYATGDNLGREIDGSDSVMIDAATAIETLLAERDGLCDIIRRKYPQSLNRECIHYYACYEDAIKNKKAGMGCLYCEKWEWRGIQRNGG